MRSVKTYLKQHSAIGLCLALLIGLFAIGNIVTRGNFATLGATVKFATLTAIFGLGQMLLIGSGGDIDLSVGYCATLVACVTAGMMDGQNVNLWKALLFATCLGVAVGLLNGFFTVYVHLPSLIVTLAMSQILQGAVDIYSAGASIGGQPSPVLKWIAGKQTGDFPYIALLLAALLLLAHVVLSRTKWGRRLVAAGANPTAAHLSGVHVQRVRMASFVACSLIAAYMGLILLGNLGMAFKDMGSPYVMPSIAAVVIGGISIQGGQQNFFGVILGAMVLQTLTNLFVSLGAGDSGKYLGYGAILLLMLIVYVREKVER